MQKATQGTGQEGCQASGQVAQATGRGLIGIVLRNNVHLSQRALLSALRQDYALGVDVLLLDNASSDGTVAWSASNRHVVHATLHQQCSLAACWNIIIQLAWKTGREHVLVLNNDVEIRSDTYRHLVAHGGPLVTCVAVDKPSLVGSPVEHIDDWGERPHPDFSCFLIRRQVTDRVGWFNEAYFPAYCEDSDYHIRLHRAGIKAVSVALPYLHHHGSTLRSANPQERAQIERGAAMNRARFRKAYGCEPGTPEYEALFSV